MKRISLAECLASADDTKGMFVKEGALEEIPALLGRYFAGDSGEIPPLFLAADENTWRAAGEELERILRASALAVNGSYIFPAAGLHGDYALVEKLAALMKERRGNGNLVPVAIGAGTINDLVKCAAADCGLPYCCLPTAASVDGYTAPGAALLRNGFKQTVPCAAPRLVAADTRVLANAPAFLSSSGYGDLAGKLIAGADWIIADRLYALDPSVPGLMPVNDRAWTMVQVPLREELAAASGAAAGDKDAGGVLFEALGITGFALQYMKDSRAVSGCEHMWAHVWEMENLRCRGETVTHGHKVVMGSLAAAAFFECLFSGDLPEEQKVPSAAEREAQVEAAFSDDPLAAEAAKKTALAKLLDGEKRRSFAAAIRSVWKELDGALKRQLPSYGELRDMFVKARCPVLPQETGLSKKRIIASARKAQMIRVRYSVLDLAFDLGVFDAILSRIEESDVYLA
ncbi:MAG: iron-containing alcohol dehydrogenase [Treponema sp.]|jgi:glycerol-1-phosphate dehydrogenase [NAD(P)+]|nr:iron-containing alcohol dehydrogenase [Treponema sp.]